MGWCLMGRPSLFTDKLAHEICERLVAGESLASICRGSKLPHVATVMRWVRGNEVFRADYVRAREDQAHADADAVGDIAHRTLAGEIDPAAARVAIDALKWTAGRRLPKIYGDRFDVNTTGTLSVTIAADTPKL